MKRELSASPRYPEKRANNKSVLVGVFGHKTPRAVAEDHLEELERLVETAGGQVVARVLQERSSPDPATFVGRGKVKEIAEAADVLGAGCTVFDDELSPSQIKNLERELPTSVIDRSSVILTIFASRARSREAMTQVELARLQYLLPRLVGSGAGLAQQRGGGAFRGGFGEKQIELDRRKIRRRIATLKDELSRIERGRRVRGKRLGRVATVALVGYTNAGKTTLFNRLTSSKELAEDRLFATLDPRHARLKGVAGRSIVVTDTVGFLRKLPHSLVASFKSTLEEVNDADLLVHLVDASSPQAEEQRQVAEAVLAGLEVDPRRVVLVYNKTDRAPGASREEKALSISAATGEGLEALRHGIVAHLEALGVTVPVLGAPRGAEAPS